MPNRLRNDERDILNCLTGTMMTLNLNACVLRLTRRIITRLNHNDLYMNKLRRFKASFT